MPKDKENKVLFYLGAARSIVVGENGSYSCQSHVIICCLCAYLGSLISATIKMINSLYTDNVGLAISLSGAVSIENFLLF